jgi:hypothetical protein
VWEQHERRQGGTFDPSEPHRLLGWHLARYYPRLPEWDPLWDDAKALLHGPVEAWLTHPRTGLPLDPARTSIAAANRAAGRALYRLFRDAGWRLLTLREQTALGIEGGHWVTGEVYAEAQERRSLCFGGVGEATLRAAHGGRLDA